MTEKLEESLLLEDAARLAGIPLDWLTPPEEGAPELALRQGQCLAGLLWRASVILIDELIDDLKWVHKAQNGADATSVLNRMPEYLHAAITPVHATKFLVSAVDLTARLTQGWRPASCLAQELLLLALLDEVEATAELHSVELHEDWRGQLQDTLLEDMDLQNLYLGRPALRAVSPDEQPDSPSHSVDAWFTPFNEERRLPPYVEA